MDYRRSRVSGGTYFFTVVTHERKNLFSINENVRILGEAFRRVQSRYPFTNDAFVIMPDHIHCIWTLPEGDSDYSTRWRLIKKRFSEYCIIQPDNICPNESRLKKGERALWQRRFWEHTIRDERDFRSHADYIHYNPVKHGYVDSPKDWNSSSFHRFVRDGIYPPDWGRGEKLSFPDKIGGE